MGSIPGARADGLLARGKEGDLFSTFAKAQLQATGLCYSQAGANSKTREQPGERCSASDCLGAVKNLCQEIPKER